MGQALRRAKADANTLVILALSLVALQTFHHKTSVIMPHRLHMKNVVPAPELDLNLAPRLSLIAGPKR